MPLVNSPLLSTVLALAATLLALSVVIQIFQEIYKYLTQSKSRAYANSLKDFLGPWANLLYRPGVLFNLEVRGPFQFKRISPRGSLQPLAKDDLLRAMERTCPPWVQRAAKALELECRLDQRTESGASANWTQFLAELSKVERAETGYWDAFEVARFLSAWGHNWEPGSSEGSIGEITVAGNRFVPANVRIAFRQRFMPHIERAATDYTQFERNVDYSYQRRNLRQTFVLAFLLALLFDLPFYRLYNMARAVTPDQAVAMAENALRADSTFQRAIRTDSVTEDMVREWAAQAKQILADSTLHADDFVSPARLEEIGRHGWFSHLFSCLVTALLLSFGAPFWNDLTSSLLQFQRGRKRGAA